MPKNNLKSWQRTAAYYRERGYTVVKTEFPHMGRRHDLLGFIDGLGLTIGQTVGLQACGSGDRAAHVRKITIGCRDKAIDWLMAGNEIHLVSWGKRKVGKRRRWVGKVERITLKDF